MPGCAYCRALTSGVLELDISKVSGEVLVNVRSAQHKQGRESGMPDRRHDEACAAALELPKCMKLVECSWRDLR